jgi:hypothetical protein
MAEENKLLAELIADIDELKLFPGYSKGKVECIDSYIETYLSVLDKVLMNGIEEGAFHDALAAFYDAAGALKYVAKEMAAKADPAISQFRERLLACESEQKTLG